MTFIVQHDKDIKRFFVVIDGKTSLLDYTSTPDSKTLDYFHTFVPPELRGQHIAEKIVKFALEYARENNYKIIPTCSFVRRYINHHPEYEKLIAI